MGQQQLLLLVLAVIIVGIAIVVGITMFNAQAASANLDAVTNDLMDLGSRAQQYYIRPLSMGGGGGSFTNLEIGHLWPAVVGATQVTNDNGTYTTTTGGQTITITGVGTQDGDKDLTPCTATATVDSNAAITIAVVSR